MQTTGSGLELRRELRIAARPETVWELLVDEEKQLRWMGVAARIDPRPGGVVRIEVIPGHVVSGEIVEIDPPRRLVYTWGWEAGPEASLAVRPGSSTVEYELVPDGTGTLLRFAHTNLPTEDAVQGHGRGWEHFLPRLELAAAGGDPGPDPWVEEL